jgi:hypothetical protein
MTQLYVANTIESPFWYKLVLSISLVNLPSPKYHQVSMSLPLKLVQMETLPLERYMQTAWLIAPQLDHAAGNCIFLSIFEFASLKATA